MSGGASGIFLNRTRRRLTHNNKPEDIRIDQLIKESNISKVLSESITKKVIIMILLMVLIMPIISDDFYSDDSSNCYSLLANYLSNFAIAHVDNLTNSTFMNTFLFSNIDFNYPIVNITYNNDLLYNNATYNQTFRNSELRYAVSGTGDITISYSVFLDTSVGGILSIVKTLYVCMILTLAAVAFENDAKVLILEPLEVMVEIVERVAKDPISARNTQEITENMKESLLNSKNKKLRRKEELKEKYEVKVIQNAIVKISALLAISFGEAGGDIIKENLTGYQDLNPMLLGKKKIAIFGFCGIRDFPTINQALQERSTTFVNEIADIVHSSVDRYGGAANKNIGDSFLMVWRITQNNNSTNSSKSGEDLSLQNKKNKRFSILTSNKMYNIQTIADMSLLGFLKVIIRIHKDRGILDYSNDLNLLNKIPDFHVDMGFGLHIGWAIEGAIGSTCKIDASYLSPNVNMAARLQAATLQYGVTILISGELYDLLSTFLKKKCRHIDTVELKGSKVPIRLYTVDVNLALKPSDKLYKLAANKKQLKYSRKKAELLADIEEYGNITDIILMKRGFMELLSNVKPKEFKNNFKKGKDYYLDGDWIKAKIFLSKCLEYCDDNPAKNLLNYMKEFNFVAPTSWKGYRTLTSK
jgi:class 3 adenylate cyclase